MTRNILEFAILSEVVNQAFKAEEEGQNDTDLFWERFSDSCPVSYGDASFTIVNSKVVIDTIAEVIESYTVEDFLQDCFEAIESEWEEAEASHKLFQERCKATQKLLVNGPEYVDLEN